MENSDTFSENKPVLRPESENKTNWKNRMISMSLAAASTMCYSLSSVFVKFLGGNVDVFIVILARFGGLFIAGLILIAFDWKNTGIELPTGREALILALRGQTATAATFFLIQGIKLLPLSDVLTIVSTVPVITIIISCVIHRKLCCRSDASMVFLTTVGVVLCVQPNFIFNAYSHESRPLTTYLKMFLAPMAISFAFIVIRSHKHLSIGFLMFIPYASAILPIVIYCYIEKKFGMAYTSLQMLNLTTVSLLTAVTVYLRDAALKLDNATICSVVRSFSIVLALIFDFAIFNVHPNALSIVGSLIVISGIVVPGIIKHRVESRN